MGNIGKKENTAGIKKVQTYKNFITATNQEMSINTVRRELWKKKQRTIRPKITGINSIIQKMNSNKAEDFCKNKKAENNLQTTSKNK